MAAPIGAHRVVVTGIGLITSLGSTLSQVFHEVLNAKSGLSLLEGAEWKSLPCRVAGIIKKESLHIDEFKKSDQREMSKPILYAVAAARRAVDNSGLKKTSYDDLVNCGVSVGMGMPDLQEIYEAGQTINTRGIRSLSPYFIPRNLVNMAAGHISIETGFKGPNLAISTACTTGLHAVGEAYRLIERGDADVMICGGSEAPISPIGLAGFSRMRALCVDSNDNPSLASRPFDKSRSGFIMSEGAAILVLENRRHALERGARVYAEILGYGLSSDAYHISAPSADGDGAYRCMSSALRDAMIHPDDVSYVNAHATSTPLGDSAEAAAIHRLFSRNRHPINVSSVKGVFGHLLGAAGSLEAAITILSCYHGKLPPNNNLVDTEIEGDQD